MVTPKSGGRRQGTSLAIYQSVFLLEGYVASATWAFPTLEGPHLLVLHVGEITAMHLLAMV